MLNNETALELKNIHKSFSQNEVLKGVSLKLEKGMIMGLLGGNGAGKSTLMKIVNGIYKMDSGEIIINGSSVTIQTAADASANGIAMVYQELSLVPTLTVVQNLFLNAEPHKGIGIDDKRCIQLAKEAFGEFGIEDIDPKAVTESLPIGKQQLVEIIKALLKRPHVLILDEPTASLTHKEIVLLFDFLKKLKKQGIAIIFISHHMQEVMQICDKAVILRNGAVAIDDYVEKLTIPKMVEAMVGRELQDGTIRKKHSVNCDDEALLSVNDLSSVDGKVNNLSMKLYSGEIVGLAGLMGSGRTELIKCIYGLQKPAGGDVFLREKKITGIRPWKAIKEGIFMIPEDRRKSGIVGIHSIKYNFFMPAWQRFAKFSCINDRKADARAEELVSQLGIKTTGITQTLNNLSGGNQQKVVFGKSIYVNPEVLLLDDPTVGVDVEAKDSICRVMADIADRGSAVLFVSSEFDQFAKVCDRVLIIKQGTIVKELIRGRDDISENAVSVETQS